MAITNQQDIPERPVVSEPWTFKRLLPLNLVSALSKTFVNSFDVLLGFIVFVFGVAIIFRSPIPTGMWVISILILGADILERQKPLLDKSKTKPNK